MNEDNGGMKPAKQPTKAIPIKLNDIAFRLILIPFFGIVIPLVTGMLDNTKLGHWEFKLSFLYTIVIAGVIWQGNRYLLFTLRAYFNWFRKPVQKIIALLLAISFYTLPVSAAMLTGWYYLFSNGRVNWQAVYLAMALILICVIFITHVYETVFLVKESETEMLRSEQLQRAKAIAELEALKSQVDPHFVFNSLNTLSHLIRECPEKAARFNDGLAEVYRYMLENKSRDLILLREEMAFLTYYVSLVTIRWESAFSLDMKVEKWMEEGYLIPPISLQLLVENAIKHNEFSEEQPLVIRVVLEDSALIVEHEKRKKALRKASSRMGLANLNDRYRLTTDRNILVQEEEGRFLVRLPLLSIS